MDYRKINSHLILLLLLVAVFVLGIATVVRLVVLRSGGDAGTANLVFACVVGVCAVVYLIILATLSNVIIPWLMKRLPVKEKTASEALNVSAVDIDKIKQNADRDYFERLKSKIDRFKRYTHTVIGPHISADELSRLDEYVERYARGEALPADIKPIRPEKLKNPDLFHFGWNMAEYFEQKKQDVVPWLQSVFTELRALEPSYIKGKLFDHQTRKYTIPNLTDIPKYLGELEG